MKCPECGKEMKRQLVNLRENYIEVGPCFPKWAYQYYCCGWSKIEESEEAKIEAYNKKWQC